MYAGRVCVRALKGLALPRASHCPVGLMPPAFHACDSASPFRVCCCHSSQTQYTRHPWLTPTALGVQRGHIAGISRTLSENSEKIAPKSHLTKLNNEMIEFVSSASGINASRARGGCSAAARTDSASVPCAASSSNARLDCIQMRHTAGVIRNLSLAKHCRGMERR